MSSRSALALVSGIALLSACAALYFWNPTLALVAFVFLLAGATAARMFPVRSRNAEALPQPPTKKASTGVASAVGGEVAAGALLETMMESMREGVLLVDSSMRVVASNGAAGEIFGGGGGKLHGRRLSELTRHPSIYAAFQAAIERGERAEVKVELTDAERRVFDLRVAPLRAGSVAQDGGGAFGVFFNITRLERLERVRQEFLSNVSHELRTPLTAILAFVETLEDGAIDDAENNRRFLAIIRRNAERMHNLINDILELSAIEAGQVVVEARTLRLRALVQDVFTALESRAAECKVELRNEVDEGVSVYADARRLEQMLTNLSDNAIKFNREGGTVTIRHERSARGDRIGVSDTGEGIAPEHAERIFERFYRIDRARSRALGGTGLGLAIVKHLARAHGGEASVRSTPGEGSTFQVELPAVPADAPPETHEAGAKTEEKP